LSVLDAVRHRERHAYIKIEYLRENTGKEIHENFCEACDGCAVLLNIVYKFFEAFFGGNN